MLFDCCVLVNLLIDILPIYPISDDTKKQILVIVLIFVTAIGVLAFVYLKFPNMSP